MKKYKQCPFCGIIDRPRLMQMERRNGDIVYRCKCARCTSHTFWCNSEKAAMALWDKGEIEK